MSQQSQSKSQSRLDNCLNQQHAKPQTIRDTDEAPQPVESSLDQGRLVSGSVSPASTTANIPPRAPRRAMRYFVPRPFPPPALTNVPVEYIIDQLHSLAPHYWSKPETADCSIIVPLDGLLRKSGQASPASGPVSDPFANLMQEQSETSSSGPSLRPAPRMVMKLHMDYLSAHSTLFRGLFSGTSPIDLVPSTSSSPQTTPRGSLLHLPYSPDAPSSSTRPSSARGLPIAPLLPRLLPSSPTHPTIYLPVPDPSSLRLLIHYMYFGSTTYIEEALDEGTVTWEGLARNVEFLGMGMDVKVCLGRWYGRWKRGRGGDSHNRMEVDYDEYSDSDEDEDSYCESDEEDGMLAYSSATSASAMDEDSMDIEDSLKRTKLDAPRGRQRTTRRLGHAISDPGPIRGLRFRPMAHVSQSSSPSTKGRGEE